MNETSWFYVALCLVIPVLWGIVAARVYDIVQARIERSRRGKAAQSDPADVEMWYI